MSEGKSFREIFCYIRWILHKNVISLLVIYAIESLLIAFKVYSRLFFYVITRNY